MTRRGFLTGTKPYLHEIELHRIHLSAADEAEVKRLVALGYNRKRVEALTHKERQRRLKQHEARATKQKPVRIEAKPKSATSDQCKLLRAMGVPPSNVDRLTLAAAEELIKKYGRLRASADQVATLEAAGQAAVEELTREAAARLILRKSVTGQPRPRKRK